MAMPLSLTYRGVPVQVAPDANIPVAYLPSKGNRAQVVQQVLDAVKPWKGDAGTIDTIIDLDPLPTIVVSMEKGPTIWAKLARHRGENTGLSPFVCAPPEHTKSFTVVLSGSPKKPVLEGAYPGEYIPLLPWQKFTHPDEYEESLAFWRTHGFIYHYNIIRPESATNIPPDWFEKEE
jgi:hypothetical protein